MSNPDRRGSGAHRRTPWWYVAVALAVFVIGLMVHLGNAPKNTACTVDDDGSVVTIHDTPACEYAFHVGDVTRWMMIVGGAFAVGITARRLLVEK